MDDLDVIASVVEFKPADPEGRIDAGNLQGTPLDETHISTGSTGSNGSTG